MSAESGHRSTGTNYQETGVQAYAAHRHGPDGAKFLDPFFIPLLQNIRGKTIDIGAGAGPWSIFAARQGANRVVAIDIQEGMTQQAKAAIEREELSSKVGVARADAAVLPSADNQFSTALSINVGCNLPSTTKLESGRKIGFEPHFTEIARVLEPGGKAVVTAPTSFGEVFTNGVRPKGQVIDELQAALEDLDENKDPTYITKYLNNFTEVHRATFAWRNNRLTLITDEKDLQSGEMIWRKLPGLTVPNYYHNENEYKVAAEKAGLRLVTQHHALFETEEDRAAHNLAHYSQPDQQLGPEYMQKPPFAVFVFEKPNLK